MTSINAFRSDDDVLLFTTGKCDRPTVEVLLYFIPLHGKCDRPDVEVLFVPLVKCDRPDVEVLFVPPVSVTVQPSKFYLYHW